MLLAIGINGITQQVEQDLFEQHPVGVHRRQRISHLLHNAHPVPRCLPIAQAHGFGGDIGNRQRLQTPGFLAQECTQALDHLGGMGCLLADTRQPLGNPGGRLRIAIQGLQVTLAGTGIIDHCCQRLVDLVGNA
ncbi:hypothetical protein D3C77_370940 [compost metagenome]